ITRGRRQDEAICVLVHARSKQQQPPAQSRIRSQVSKRSAKSRRRILRKAFGRGSGLTTKTRSHGERQRKPNHKCARRTTKDDHFKLQTSLPDPLVLCG